MGYDDLKFKNIELDDCVISIMNISFPDNKSEHTSDGWHEKDITTNGKSMFEGSDNMFVK